MSNLRSILRRTVPVLLLAALVVFLGTSARRERGSAQVQLEISRIYWEYNASGDDLGVHVSLDGEDWKTLKIIDPNGHRLFEVRGQGPYAQLGLTELFFEGAEPTLSEFPLEDLLALFPEGEYEFEGRTVDGEPIEGESLFTHAIPAAPNVSVLQGPDDLLRISWTDVTGPPPGFPNVPIVISGYQILVDGDTFQLTLPGSANSVTLPPEFVAAMRPGTHAFEVLAIEQGGNQTIREGTFVK